MDYYIYKGPVMEFGRCIENTWYGKTKEPSPEKARSNLAYRYKKDTGRLARTKIELPGRLVMEGERYD